MHQKLFVLAPQHDATNLHVSVSACRAERCRVLNVLWYYLQMHVVAETNTVVGREAVLRTSMGDIRTKLFPDECPKVHTYVTFVTVTLSNA